MGIIAHRYVLSGERPSQVQVTFRYRDETGKLVLNLEGTGEIMSDSQKLQVFVPKKEGGLGMGSMLARMRPAWLGAWEGGLGMGFHRQRRWLQCASSFP